MNQQERAARYLEGRARQQYRVNKTRIPNSIDLVVDRHGEISGFSPRIN